MRAPQVSFVLLVTWQVNQALHQTKMYEHMNIDERVIVCDDILSLRPIQFKDFEELDKSAKQGDYVLVEFRAKKATFYIRKVIEGTDCNVDFVVSFVRQSEICAS